MARLSVVVLTHNEQQRIEGCLQSLTWAQEVVVVDSLSTDRTLDICRRFPNVRVVQHAWPGYGPQRNFALTQTDADWVLMVDADERVTPQLGAEIQRVLASDPPQAAFWIRRVNLMGGPRPVEFPPERLLRLFRRASVIYTDLSPHAKQVVRGTIGRLRGALVHEFYRDLPDFVARNAAYAYTVAELMAASGKRSGMLALIGHTLAAFWRKFLVKGGFRAGPRGLIYAGLIAFYTFLKYARLWELQQLQQPAPASRRHDRLQTG